MERLHALFDDWGRAPAIQFVGDGDERWTAWGEIGALHDALDRALPTVGSAAEATVVMRQRPALLAAELAVLARGWTASLVTPLQADRTLVAELRSMMSPVVVAHSADWARPGVADAIADAGGVGVEIDDDLMLTLRTEPRHGDAESARPPDVAVTVLTSGTTGPPKRLPVSWSTFVELGRGAPGRPPTTGRGAVILSLPIATLGGLLSLTRLVFGGRPLAMIERFEVRTWAELVRQHRPSIIGAPPPAVKMILDADISPDHFDGVTAFVTASAPVDPAITAEFERRYGIPVLVGYGATEFLGSVTGWTEQLWRDFGPAKRGSVGRPLAGVRLRVVDPDAEVAEDDDPREVPANTPGLLEVDPAQRAGGLPEGWLRTSDRARIDQDGFVWILGRSDGVIVRGGFKVDLGLVERTLRDHPAVAEVAVVGLPDQRLGQVPGAVVVDDGRGLAADELTAWLRERLPAYAVPATFEFVDALPRTATMKIDVAAVRARLTGPSTASDTASTAVMIGDRRVGRLGFGAMRVMGAKGPDGHPSRDAAVALVRRALDRGVTFIDTADIYGDGASEEIIAFALHPYPPEVVVATKGGFVPGVLAPGQRALPADCRPERLRQVCEASLRRLRVERIDLYQLHTPDSKVPFEDSIGALIELREAGKIDQIGLSNVGRKHVYAALALTPIASVQNRYNLCDRSSERVLEACETAAIAFLPWGPVQVGDDATVAAVAAELGATTQQVAVAWLLQRSPMMLPIPGTSSIAHLDQNVAAAALDLTDEHVERLDRCGEERLTS
jgi:aryl-alcohol dehydrogenase-like predicted oxidoreductase/acyl-CoA synthetase (AMP-forming)/AMP-acid ligase II